MERIACLNKNIDNIKMLDKTKLFGQIVCLWGLLVAFLLMLGWIFAFRGKNFVKKVILICPDKIVADDSMHNIQ